MASLNLTQLFIGNMVGAALDSALWGAGCMQLYVPGTPFFYFVNYRTDHWALKLLVMALWLTNTAITALTFATVFLTITSQSLEGLVLPSSVVIRTLLSNVIAVAVQFYFLRRIYHFSTKGWIIVTCLALAGVISSYQLVCGSLYTVWALPKNVPIAVSLTSSRDVSMEISCRAVSSFVDTLIAAWMTTLLLLKRHIRLLPRSSELIHNLLILTINTGLWTAIIALVDFSLVAWRPTGVVYAVFEYPLASLYFNTLLANLNIRKHFRRGQIVDLKPIAQSGSSSSGTSGRSIGTGEIPLARMPHRTALGQSEDSSFAIRIDRSMAVRSDDDSSHELKDVKV
ncbi:uncharacterized protein PHACADRAFT_212839 [Phanerochaete carnosa HHB-10118-sp]|uniref:DUF6534 domain-containing protein n=1 Tax=Phanerochaete carnosa (strain HHB-10118-sp) TaxID=650164 RepID=K5VI42_PHACS|nr:uncharacterized protein PHACADRAFT_212839 [Phanerochaete carnosa HHB-10118-sp]EKM50923.1 hypothetical protein PHACADRAFT_212839 [Phanerochaete carnosa HHB-10118-sp]